MSELKPIEAADWSKAQPGDVLAVFSSYDSLLAGLIRKKEALRFNHLELDERANLTSGYTSKLFGPSRIKKLGPTSMGALLDALGLKLALLAADPPDPPINPKRQKQGEAA